MRIAWIIAHPDDEPLALLARFTKLLYEATKSAVCLQHGVMQARRDTWVR